MFFCRPPSKTLVSAHTQSLAGNRALNGPVSLLPGDMQGHPPISPMTFAIKYKTTPFFESSLILELQ